MRALREFFTVVRYLFVPNYCTGCHVFMVDTGVLCHDCSLRLQPVAPCFLTLEKNSGQGAMIPVISCARYEEPLMSLVQAKRKGNRVAARLLGKIMIEHMDLTVLAGDYLVPVPLHWLRYSMRGFNQAYELARVLGLALDRPVVSLVKRVRKTIFQAQLSAEQRARNVINAFVLTVSPDDPRYREKKIVLVDDVMTTGSTLKEVAHVLMDLKPVSLTALVACRAG